VNSRRAGIERQQSQGLPAFSQGRLIACSVMVSDHLMDASAVPYREIIETGNRSWRFHNRDRHRRGAQDVSALEANQKV